MLEQSFGLNFFLKTPQNQSKTRVVYVRVTVDGVAKDKSTKRKWDATRWDQKAERATGNKEDARVLNYFLESDPASDPAASLPLRGTCGMFNFTGLCPGEIIFGY